MRTDLWVSLGLVAFALTTMPVFAARRSGGVDALESSARGTFVLGSFFREWFYWFQRPVERVSLALGLTPLFYNLTGVFFGAMAGLCFATGRPVLGGWAVLLGGVADVLDGRIARRMGIASRRGAFLDSSLDRFAELGAFIGLAVYFNGASLGLIAVTTALGGSLLVSYARARGESVGVVCKLGIMQRAERLLLLGFGGILDPLVAQSSAVIQPGQTLLAVVGLIAVGTVGTAAFRVVWIARRLPYVDE